MKGVVSAFFYTFARKNCIYKMNFKHNIPLQSHLSMLMAEVFWGLMAPLGKDAMTHGFDGISMVSMRVMGGAILFWLTALFTKKEKVPLHDKLLFAGAAVFGLACNHAHLRHGACFPDIERAYHVPESPRSVRWFLWSCDFSTYKCGRSQRQSG